MSQPRAQTWPSTATPPTEGLAVQVQGLVKCYGSLVAVNGIDFTVAPGEIFGLIGPDGAGKTTTFQILAGVMEASRGTATVMGRPPRQARLHSGYLTQRFSLYSDLSVEENLRYSAGLRRVPPTRLAQRIPELLQRMGLAPFRQRLAGQLSGGMKQKLALCCALVASPRVLLLDEPTTGVDPVSRREFWDLLAAVAAAGVTVVTATPYLDEAERCHRIGLIYNGQIQRLGTPAELRASLNLRRLEVRPSSGELLEQRLRTDDVLVDLQPFGDRLDVLVTDAAQGKARIQERLQQPPESIREDQPTLENVFVNRLRQQGADPPYRPFPAYGTGQPPGQVAIAAHSLVKAFGDFRAVDQLDLQVHYGEIYGLLGANGAGKTTTIKMLCGLLPPTAGAIQLAGENQALQRAQVRSQIGYMSQKFTLYDDLTVLQNLKFYCGVYGVPPKQHRPKIDWVLETCGLTGQEHLLTASLPGGWKQRVAFGAAVLHEPRILFLDEPTSGVDPLARRQFWRFIRDFAQRGTAVLVTTHYLEEAENCHRMAFMAAGHIVAEGSPSEIKHSQPGQLVELVCERLQEASDLLKQRLEPWRVAIFGERLHLVFDHPKEQIPQVRQWLQEAEMGPVSLQPIPFTLEDAFIGIVQRAAV